MLKRNKHELRVPFDVDGTLIRPCRPGETGIKVRYYGMPREVVPMKGNIELLKAYKKRGYEVTVHSANGEQWAYEIVRALGLEDFVDWTATKNLKFVDDVSPELWAHVVHVDDY